jgi:hypothetical protein
MPKFGGGHFTVDQENDQSFEQNRDFCNVKKSEVLKNLLEKLN